MDEEIRDSLGFRKVGHSVVEGSIGNYVADVLFENEWAFEVVCSNPPSEQKMIDLKDKMIIFNLNDLNMNYLFQDSKLFKNSY